MGREHGAKLWSLSWWREFRTAGTRNISLNLQRCCTELWQRAQNNIRKFFSGKRRISVSETFQNVTRGSGRLISMRKDLWGCILFAEQIPCNSMIILAQPT